MGILEKYGSSVLEYSNMHYYFKLVLQYNTTKFILELEWYSLGIPTLELEGRIRILLSFIWKAEKIEQNKHLFDIPRQWLR